MVGVGVREDQCVDALQLLDLWMKIVRVARLDAAVDENPMLAKFEQIAASADFSSGA